MSGRESGFRSGAWGVAAIVVFVSCLSVGCKSQSSVAVRIGVGEAAAIDVTGEHFEVKLENEGPGAVRAVWDSPDDTKDVEITLSGKGYYKFDFPGPLRVTAETTGDESTQIRITAYGATAVGAKVSPVSDQRGGSSEDDSSSGDDSSSSSSSSTGPPGK